MNGDLISRSALDLELQSLVKEYNRNCESDKSSGAFEALYRLRLAPAVDAVEVIRCKDCFYWMKAKVNRNGNLVCPKSGMEIVATDYCSRAERRICKYER